MKAVVYLVTCLLFFSNCTDESDLFVSDMDDLSKHKSKDIKIEICHFDGKKYKAKKVKLEDLEEHLAHGDINPDQDGDGYTAAYGDLNPCEIGNGDDCDDNDRDYYPGQEKTEIINFTPCQDCSSGSGPCYNIKNGRCKALTKNGQCPRNYEPCSTVVITKCDKLFEDDKKKIKICHFDGKKYKEKKVKLADLEEHLAHGDINPDQDGDGYTAAYGDLNPCELGDGDDCDDTNARVYPGDGISCD